MAIMASTGTKVEWRRQAVQLLHISDFSSLGRGRIADLHDRQG